MTEEQKIERLVEIETRYRELSKHGEETPRETVMREVETQALLRERARILASIN